MTTKPNLHRRYLDIERCEDRCFLTAVAEVPDLVGDIDGDGEVAYSDFLILQTNFNMEGGPRLPSEGDLTGDGVIDFKDFIKFADHYGEKLSDRPENTPGDADGDGEVDFQDFLILSNNYGEMDAVFADGDFDGNGVVGFADFLILSNNYGPETTPGGANENGEIDYENIQIEIMRHNFGKTDAALADGDLDGNGVVDFADFLILSETYS